MYSCTYKQRLLRRRSQKPIASSTYSISSTRRCTSLSLSNPSSRFSSSPHLYISQPPPFGLDISRDIFLVFQPLDLVPAPSGACWGKSYDRGARPGSSMITDRGGLRDARAGRT